MKLQTLITQANRTYELGLDTNGMSLLYNRLRNSGHATEVSAKSTSAALDAILSVADTMADAQPKPRSVYASLKVEAAPADIAEDSCPRCRIKMRTVNLVGGKAAAYCEPCHISLPLRIE